MRSTIVTMILGIAVFLPACSKGENAGAEQAKAEADREQKQKEQHGEVAKKINPPVPGRAKLSCANVIDIDKFTALLGETTPVTLEESKSEPEAAASCSILRGGKRLTAAEQQAALKKNGHLGVMAGDELCNISTFCWTIEDADRFIKKCAESKDQTKEKVDSSLGFPACLLIVATGENDVNRWRFFDADTKCIIQVRAGPSNVDNELTGKCAKGAENLIGPDQIKVQPAPAAIGSGSGK